MDFLEAMRKVRDEGKRVRRTDENGTNGEVYKDENGVYRELFLGADIHFIFPESQLDTFIDSTWEVVE